MDTQKQLFTIQQLSLKLNIPKPTLRFWEKELDGIIVPQRTRGGQRRYTAEHISIIETITALKKSGKSLSEIKDKLSNNKTKDDDFYFDEIDILAKRIARVVRAEVYNFFQK